LVGDFTVDIFFSGATVW